MDRLKKNLFALWGNCTVTQSLQFNPDQVGNVLVFFSSAYKHVIVTVLRT